MTLFTPMIGATVDRLNAAAGLGVAVQASRALPTKDEGLPYAIVFARASRSRSLGPDGPLAFDRTIDLFVVYRTGSASGPDGQALLEDAAVRIRDTLFHDADWVARFQDIEGYDVSFEPVQQTEPLLMDCVFRISIVDGEHFEPVPTDFTEVRAEPVGGFGVDIGQTPDNPDTAFGFRVFIPQD